MICRTTLAELGQRHSEMVQNASTPDLHIGNANAEIDGTTYMSTEKGHVDPMIAVFYPRWTVWPPLQTWTGSLEPLLGAM